MKLIFIGTGSAFTLDNYQSNIVVEAPEGRLLIDCGGDARRSLAEIGLSSGDISAVYISHLHNDHIGGLEWLGLTTYFSASKDDPSLRPRLHLHHTLVQDLWLSLHGGMGTIQGRIAGLDTYFDVRPIERNGGFRFAQTEFRTVQMVHYYDGFELVPTYGLMFENSGIRAFITGDTQDSPHQVKDFRALADYIFQDCETAKTLSSVHAHYRELKSLDAAVKGRMWLYDYQDGKKPDCTKDGFLGWIEKGQVFDFDAPASFRGAKR